MKKSEKIKKEAAKVESDSKAFGLYTKAIREERIERFKDEWIDKFEEAGVHFAYSQNQNKYMTETEHGTIDFYPKANKVLIRKKNKWIKPGLKWLITNLLKP